MKEVPTETEILIIIIIREIRWHFIYFTCYDTLQLVHTGAALEKVLQFSFLADICARFILISNQTRILLLFCSHQLQIGRAKQCGNCAHF